MLFLYKHVLKSHDIVDSNSIITFFLQWDM